MECCYQRSMVWNRVVEGEGVDGVVFCPSPAPQPQVIQGGTCGVGQRRESATQPSLVSYQLVGASHRRWLRPEVVLCYSVDW